MENFFWKYKGLIFTFLMLAVTFAWAEFGRFDTAPEPSKKAHTYSSEYGLQPESQQARKLISECLKKTQNLFPGFHSSWRIERYSNTDMGYFYCDLKENIDYRERGRLNLSSDNPQKIYHWRTEVQL
jgi:hypothetical protein